LIPFSVSIRFDETFIAHFLESLLILFLPSSMYKPDKDSYECYFDDLNQGWYKDVGLTILIAMLVTISTPIAYMIVQKILGKLKEKKLNKC